MATSTASVLYYLVKLHKTPTTSYYAAYEHTPDGLKVVWPTDSSDCKAAKTEGWHYAQPSNAVPVAYSIKVNEPFTDHANQAKQQLINILANKGQNTAQIEVCELKGATSWPIN